MASVFLLFKNLLRNQNFLELDSIPQFIVMFKSGENAKSMQVEVLLTKCRGGSSAQSSKIERFVIIVTAVNYYHKALHLGCCSSPRSASEVCRFLY